MAGAQVVVPGTVVGAITDEAGAYHLSGVPIGEIEIRVEMLGYTAAEKRVSVAGGRATTADFELVPQVFYLDEVVVTGTAGSARQREVAHSIDYILPGQVAEPVADVDDLLAARVPGLNVFSGSGTSGSGAQIRLRGNASMALSNQPLVYLDGLRIRSDGFPLNVPPTGDPRRSPNDVPSPLNDVNPADIERVEVVKGPAATTLYGAEAATGVIQIFTKRGSAGRPVWAAQVDQGFDELRPFGTEADPYLGLAPWLDTAWRQRYTLSVGGGANLRYYVSGAYDDNEGVLPNDWQKRLGVRGNFDARPVEGLDLSWSTSYTNNDLSNTPSGNNGQGLTFNVFRREFDFLGDAKKAALDSILDYEITTGIDHLIAGLTATYAPSQDLTNRLTVGYDRGQSAMRQLRPFGFIFAPDGILSEQRWVSRILTLDYVGSLARPLVTDLRGIFSWGGQRVSSAVESVAEYGESFPGPGPAVLDSAALRLQFEDRTRVVNGGAFAQTLLDWRNRWFLTAGLRLDSHTAFGEDLGLQPYPRVGLSYVISEEAFWPDAWGSLKLRAAYGHAGRSPGAFDALRTFTDAGLDGEPAFLPDRAGNPELGPERTAGTEVGFEGAFLDDRLTIDATVYYQKTTDALFPVTQTPSLGFPGTQLENVGTLRNQGVELALTGAVLRGGDVGWDVGIHLATNHSKVLDLGGAPPFHVSSNIGWILEGQPAPVLRGTYVANPDEIAEPEIQNEHVFGPNLPPLTLGIETALQLPAGFRLSARGEYQGGHYIGDRISRAMAVDRLLPRCSDAYALLDQGLRERLTAWERLWCEPDDVPQDGFIYPANFFRVRDVTLEAPVPFDVLRRGHTTLTISVRNWWTWKNDELELFDPEIPGSGGIHSALRLVDGHVPAPATLTVSLRTVH